MIARPFAGTPGAFVRTKDRKDFSLEPTGTTYLDLLVARGIPVVGVGKISQIFAGRGVSEEWKVASNDDNLALVTEFLESGRDGLLFSNLVDFDMAWGHRNDPEGFARGLEAVDRALPRLLAALGPAGPAAADGRSRRRPHDGGHRPHPGVRAAAVLPAAGRARRRPATKG